MSGSVYNFYNRISSARLVSKDQMSSRTRGADNINKRDSENGDDLYDELDRMDALRYEEDEKNLEYVYQEIFSKVELYDELKDAIEKFCDAAITPDGSGRYFSIEVDGSVDKYLKDIILESHDEVMDMLGFNDHKQAWKTFYEWSLFGKVSYRIVYEFKTRDELAKEKAALRADLGLIPIKLKEAKEDEEKKRLLEEIKENINNKISHVENVEKFKSFKKDENDEELIAVGLKGIKKVNFLALKKQKEKDGNGIYWQYGQEVLSDNEIVIINYNDVSGNHLPINRYGGTPVANVKKISYAHKLLRNFNILTRMETTVVSWTVLNAMYRQVTIVPITTKVSSKAKEALSKLRNKYLDNFTVDNEGNVRLNGETSFNTMKHMTLGERNGVKPSVETVEWNGFDLSDMKPVSYFRNRFIDTTRLPYSRFDKEGQSGGLSIYKADGIPFTEASFYSFLDRVLHQFSQVVKKPTVLSCHIKDPKLTIDESFETKIRYSWESMDYYFKARTSEKEAKVLSDIDQLMKFEDANGTIFSHKYLFTKRFNFMTEEEWDEMIQMKLKDNKAEEETEETDLGI